MASRSLTMRRPVRPAVQPISHNPAMQGPWKLPEAVTPTKLARRRVVTHIDTDVALVLGAHRGYI